MIVAPFSEVSVFDCLHSLMRKQTSKGTTFSKFRRSPYDWKTPWISQRRISVEVNVRGRDLAGFVAEAQKKVDDAVHIPSGYQLEWGGQFEQLESASQRLMIVVPVALTLIFVLLYINFQAVMPALLIFLNIPLAATGGIVALLLRGMPFSISAGVGFIALFGVAVLIGCALS